MTEFLERDDLLGVLEAARERGGELVLVGGEAGVGKTTLVRAFAERSRARVFVGACENLTTPTPLGPLLDIAAEVGGSFEVLVNRGGEPRDVARALLDALRDPAVVVLEDLHWGDQATLDALRVLGRRIESSPAMLLATYRDDEVGGDHPLRMVLGELASAPAVARMTVPRLSLEAVCELAAPSRADGNAIHRLTQGNAFYVTEILEADAGRGALPETVRDAVLARVASLDPPSREVLDLVALVPARAELWLLAAVAGTEPAGLDACLASGTLREDDNAVAFRHELARRAVESAVPAHRRRRLHGRLLEALGAPPVGSPDASRLAHHAEQAGDVRAVLRHAPAAARRAAETGAHREAAAQYARALRAGAHLPAAERAGLLDNYALEAQLTGLASEAAVAWKEAAALFHDLGDTLAEGRSLAWLTRACIPAGRNAEAEEASRSAIAVLESVAPSAELARAYATQSYVRMLNRDNADGVAWGKKAVALAEDLGDVETLAYGLNSLGTSHVVAGDIERGVELLLRSVDVARENGVWLWIGPGLSMLGSGLGEMYELERSERYLREHIAFTEEHDLWPQYSRSWLALVHVYRGHWDEGAELAHDVLRTADDAISRISALIAIGRLRSRRGDPGAVEMLDEALELARPGGHLQRLGHVHAARAEAAWLAGDPQLALEEAHAAYQLALEKRHLWFAGELVYWQVRAGAVATWPDWIAAPYRLQLAGSHEAAAKAWRAHGCPYEAARALAESDDEPLLTEALMLFEQLGARTDAHNARQQLRAGGASVPRGPRPSTRANPGELTDRELEVLRLVAAGKRNAAIAAELVVSTRTVDHHVSAILRKLGVRTRGEAAAIALRSDEQPAHPG